MRRESHRVTLVSTILALAVLAIGGPLGAASVPPAKPQTKSLPPVAAGPEPAAAALAIGAELRWDGFYAGDPLWVRVRLSSPRAHADLFRQAQAEAQGQPATGATFAAPKVSPDWASGVMLTLSQVDDAGKRAPVLQGAAWAPHLVKPKEQLPDLGLDFMPLIREWVVGPEAAPLAEGRYLLEVAWNGKGMVDSSLLPNDGVLRGEEIAFEVKSPADDSQRAEHLSRLARVEYLLEKYEQARDHGRQALRLWPDVLSPERVQTYFVVGNSSIGLKDYKSAEDLYRELLEKLPPPQNDHVASMAKDILEALEAMTKPAAPAKTK
jgi:tetratricopeptide (TPR) repeat protein